MAGDRGAVTIVRWIPGLSFDVVGESRLCGLSEKQE